MMRHAAVLLFLVFLAVAARAAKYPAPNEDDFIAHNFKFTSGETMPELRLHLPDPRKARERCEGRNAKCRCYYARDDWERRAIHPAGVRRRTLRTWPTTRHSEIFHRSARRHRAWQIEQTERRDACKISTLRLP